MTEAKITMETKENIVNIPVSASINSISSHTHTPITISTNTSFNYYDPIAEKFKELEARIDAWQNKFEFVNVKEK